MVNEQPFDPAVLGAHLEAHVAGFSGLKAIEKFGTGQSNPTYKLMADSGNYVLRAKPPGDLLKSAHQVDREFRVMGALAPTPVPVPEMLYLSGDGEPIGRMFFVMPFLDGRIFWNPALPDLDNDGRTEVYDEMNRVLAALHDVDPVSIGLEDFGRPGNYFARQLNRWSRQYRASQTDDLADMDALMNWLDEHLPPDDGAVSIVHGDYRIDNMIFDRDRPDMIALIDWELSTLGHPMADLAYQCMQWRLPEGETRGLGNLDRVRLGLPSETGYVETYCKRRGLSGVDNWTFYLAFGFFRLAAILQGVVKRAMDGNASNPEAGLARRPRVAMLSTMAVEMIEQEG